MTKIKEIENQELINEANEFTPVGDMVSTNKQDAIAEVYLDAVKSDTVNKIEVVTEYPATQEPGVLYIKVE